MMFSVEIRICGTCVHNIACNGIKGHGTWHSEKLGVLGLEHIIALATHEFHDVYKHECEDKANCICCRDGSEYYYDLNNSIFEVLALEVAEERAEWHVDGSDKCPQCPHCYGEEEL